MDRRFHRRLHQLERRRAQRLEWLQVIAWDDDVYEPDGTFTDYTKWAGGEPNDWRNGAACCDCDDGAAGEDCTHLRGDGLWNDAGCDGVRRYVCGYSDAGRAPMGDWDIDSCTYTKPDSSLPMQTAEAACIK